MTRRAAGGCVLLLALLAILAVPAMVRTGTAGTASAAALPAPPSVGTCVVLTESTVDPIDCGRPHDAEVFTSWLADDPAQPTHSANACAPGLSAIGRVTLPSTLAAWDLTVFNATAELIRAPGAERVGARGWLACLLRPASQARYVGSVVADAAPTRSQPIDRPSAFGRCLYYDHTTTVACDTPHSAEMLATSWRSVPIPTATPTDDKGLPSTLGTTLNADCLAVATLLTGNPDPTYGGRLTVQVTSAATGSGWGTDEGSVAQYDSQCLLVSTSGQLTDSVVDLGTGPLPTT